MVCDHEALEHLFDLGMSVFVFRRGLSGEFCRRDSEVIVEMAASSQIPFRPLDDLVS